MFCQFATTRCRVIRTLLLTGALVFGVASAQADDSCFINTTAILGDEVPFTMVSNRADNTFATYTTGLLTVFHSARVGHTNYLSNKVGQFFDQLLSDQFVPGSGFGTNQPFSIQNPQHPVFLEIFDRGGIATLEAFDQNFRVIADVQMQCGGAQDRLLIGSDANTTYVVSFGTPFPPPPPPQ